MDSQDIIYAFAVLYLVIGIAGLTWAIRHRQFRSLEAAKDVVTAEVDDQPQDVLQTRNRWALPLITTILSLIFGFICWSIMVAIMASTSMPQPAHI